MYTQYTDVRTSAAKIVLQVTRKIALCSNRIMTGIYMIGTNLFVLVILTLGTVDLKKFFF